MKQKANIQLHETSSDDSGPESRPFVVLVTEVKPGP